MKIIAKKFAQLKILLYFCTVFRFATNLLSFSEAVFCLLVNKVNDLL